MNLFLLLTCARQFKIFIKSIHVSFFINSDGDKYVEKIKLIDFNVNAMLFVWHFDKGIEFDEIPNEVLNKLSMKLNRCAPDLDILPLRLLINTAIPKYSNTGKDLQFVQSSNGNYVVTTYNGNYILFN